MISLAAEAARCMRCGNCRAVCPVCEITRRENDSARGRLLRIRHALAADRWAARDREALSRCLLCGRCTEVCHVHVETPRAVQAAKAASGAAAGLTDFAAEYLLGDGGRLETATRRWRRFAAWLGRATPDDSGLRLRFSLPYAEAGRWLPKPPAISYLEKNTGRAARGREKIAIFAGCGAGRLFAGVGEALDRVLAKYDLVAAVPEQSCCGLPAWGIGADRAAKTAAANWVEAFRAEEYDAILTPCASCAAHLQKMGKVSLTGSTGSLGHDEDEATFAADAARLAAKVEDVFAWLARREPQFDLEGQRVAVHLPCHARRGVRDGTAVLQVLARSGAEIVQLPDEIDRRCCGMGGSFGARHPDLSREIARPKIEAMLAAKPDAIVSNCTGCLVQLRDGVGDNLGVPVRHAIELLG